MYFSFSRMPYCTLKFEDSIYIDVFENIFQIKRRVSQDFCLGTLGHLRLIHIFKKFLEVEPGEKPPWSKIARN